MAIFYLRVRAVIRFLAALNPFTVVYNVVCEFVSLQLMCPIWRGFYSFICYSLKWEADRTELIRNTSVLWKWGVLKSSHTRISLLFSEC